MRKSNSEKFKYLLPIFPLIKMRGGGGEMTLGPEKWKGEEGGWGLWNDNDTGGRRNVKEG